MSSEIAIAVQDVGKCYELYERPSDRLRQFVLPRAHRLLGRHRRYYREFWALRDVSFQIGRGEQVGIVGRNGAGKSTLLQIICGTLAPTTGSVQVDGRIAALLELGAGFNPELTGAENVFLNGSVLGLAREDLEQRYDSILAFADIGDFIRQPVKNYSSGMYMRLAFAIAVHVDPDVLVVDEALSVGDEAFQRKCNARIQRIRDNGATILFVSHSASHVIEVCSRAVLIDHGRMLALGSAKHVVSRYHKLVYAPADRVAAMREEMLGELGRESEVEVARPAPVQSEVDEAYWEPGLVPQSTVVYPSLGCEILDPHLLAADGRRVNVLQPGREYTYVYHARFDSAAAAVRFGMMLKTVHGVELGGAVSTPASTPHEFFPACELVRVEFAFRAQLAPGTYFLNAGVTGMVGEQETYLARVVDVALFRVLKKEDTTATGLVDLGFASDVVRVDALPPDNTGQGLA
jgi:lipopolysaccharide transport system ATP-binding protein